VVGVSAEIVIGFGMEAAAIVVHADQNADAPAHHSDEFPAGYSLTRCSPAALVSASPAGPDDAIARAQLRVLGGKTTKRIALKMKTV